MKEKQERERGREGGKERERNRERESERERERDGESERGRESESEREPGEIKLGEGTRSITHHTAPDEDLPYPPVRHIRHIYVIIRHMYVKIRLYGKIPYTMA